jgi:hypothetical protein
MNFSQPVYPTGVKKNSFGDRGFSGVNMRRDPDISN